MISKLLLTTIGFLTFSCVSYAQNIYFKFTNGSTATYSINDIRNITFKGDTMNLLKRDGTVQNWSISTVGNYRYDAATSVSNSIVSNTKFKIFPNPFYGSLTILYDLSSADMVKIEILDMIGRTVKRWPPIFKSSGNHQLVWNSGDDRGNAVSAGTYVCRVSTSKGIVSKIIIKQ
jgi:hypothetical protein